MRSHSVAAQGGINAALGNHPESTNDSWEAHAVDTIKGGDFLNDQDTVALMCKEAGERVIGIEHWGCPFSRTDDGRIAQRRFGGGAFPRAVYAAERKRLDGLVECILCGLCFSACPVTSLNEDYSGPAALLKLERFIEDRRDKYEKRFDIGSTRQGIWSCRSVFNCQEVCPKSLTPARAINSIRHKIIKNKFFKR